jgi:hypothetical protein
MTKVLAKDFRKKAPSGAVDREIEYDPATVQEFDTRGKSPTKYQETWGQRVDVQVEGEPCVLYLELYSRSVNHVNLNRNILKDC